MNTDGSKQTRLTHDLDDEYYPAWSPTGEHIAFVGNASGNYQIYVMNKNGSGQRRVTHDDAYDADPAWTRLP
jgi:TolB protein